MIVVRQLLVVRSRWSQVVRSMGQDSLLYQKVYIGEEYCAGIPASRNLRPATSKNNRQLTPPFPQKLS